jgi:amino acid adenylation domain-containing protein/thioester reductase-like protein
MTQTTSHDRLGNEFQEEERLTSALPSEEDEIYALPASFAQQRLWFLEQWEPGVYNIAVAGSLSGHLDMAGMEYAFQTIIQRHEVLRTTFDMVNSQLLQVIAPTMPFTLGQIDLQGFPEDIMKMKVRRLIKEDSQRPFDLQHGPLIRATVLKKKDQAYTLLIAMHHIVSDGWSMEVLFQELLSHYTAYVTGEPAALPPLPVQYADYTLWQQQRLQGEMLEEQLSYWRQQLGGLPVLQLPADHPRPAIQTFRGAGRGIVIPADLTAALYALSRSAGVTLFMTLLGAFQTVLFRYTAQETIPVGVPIAGRTERNLEPLIGCFINTLVMATNFAGNPTFLEVLKRTREVSLGAYEHQDIPFEKLAEALQPERDLSHNPLTQVMFALQNVPQGEMHMPNLTLTPLQPAERAILSTMGASTQGAGEKHQAMLENKTAMFDLDIMLWEREDHLLGEIKYNTDLFEPATIDRLYQHFLTLLAAIVAHPATRVSELPLLTVEEQQQILEEWNPSLPVSLPSDHVLTAFAQQVKRSPLAVAVSDEQRQLTYGELDHLATRLARHLQSHAIEAEQLVGVYSERGVTWAISVLGLLKAEAVYLPLDPRHPEGRLRSVLTRSGCQWILTTRALLPRLSAALAAAAAPQILCLEDLLEHEPVQAWREPAYADKHLAYVIYTSGSTGQPKGAMLEQRGMLNHLYAKIADLQLDEHDIVAQTASQCFDISIWQLLASWLVGAQTRIYSDRTVADPQRLLQAVAEDGVTILEVVPSWLSALLDTQQETGICTQLPHLRWLIPTGEALSGDLCKRWLQSYPQIALLNAYGPTECSDDITHQVITALPEQGELPSIMPIGKTLANLRIYVLDRQMQLQPIGIRGELYVGGIGVGRGYLADPVRTAETFVPDPWSAQAGARLYRTGDLGLYRADGSIEFLGRRDQQVKLRGYRIEPGEIEQALRRQPGVKESVVVVDTQTPGREQLVAYITAQEHTTLVPETLLHALKAELPEYMVPAVIMPLESIPLTANGKIDRQALPTPATSHEREDETTYLAPRDPLEEQLAEMWCELLGLRRVSITDDFFAIGGHSLLTVRLLSRIEKRFGKRLPVAAIFQNRTIKALAETLRRYASSSPWSLTAEAGPSTVDLQAEATLSLACCPEIWSGRLITEPERILLTGATGFIGTFLLAELLKQTTATISCLVRTTDASAGQRKIQQALERAYLWQPEFQARIHVLPGDLAQPRLGLDEATFAQLAEQIEVIYHNGAAVNMLYPYEALQAANVEGTREIIRLATTGPVKTLHYVSTLSVFAHKGETLVQRVREQDNIDEYHKYVRGGYAQSKWVAEKLVTIARSRGLPVVIYRPGRVTGHSQSGAWRDEDTLSLMIRGCIQLGMSPALASDTLEMVPVDYVCQAIVALARRKTSPGQAFHLYNPATTRVRDVITWIRELGYDIQQVAYPVWQAELARQAANGEENALAPLLELFLQPGQDVLLSPPTPEAAQAQEAMQQVPVVLPETRQTQAALARTGITCPPLDARLIRAYLAYMVENNQLKAPAQHSR